MPRLETAGVKRLMKKHGKNQFAGILSHVAQYYGEKILQHGTTARGVDWNSAESQLLRFEQLLKIHRGESFFTVNDYGCGYGALAAYLTQQRKRFEYRGLDVSGAMIASGKKLHRAKKRVRFFTQEAALAPADYTVASGIFNVKLGTTNQKWKEYVLYTLKAMDRLSTKGFSFNMLTRYSDKERMRPDLYYADPLFLFDFCKRNFSKKVALLHDYELYEFTMLVKK